MILTPWAKVTLAYRRQKRELLAKGYEHVGEPIWQIVRGARRGEVITDAIISADGLSVYLKTSPRELAISPETETRFSTKPLNVKDNFGGAR